MRDPRAALIVLLRAKNEEIADRWTDATSEVPGFKAITRGEYKVGIKDFLSLFLAHIEDPEELGLHGLLRRLAERCRKARIPEPDLVRGRNMLRRILIETLLREFAGEPSGLAYMYNRLDRELERCEMLFWQFFRRQHRNMGQMWRTLSEKIIDTIPTALVILDGNLSVCRANERFCERFGLDPGEVVGMPLKDVLPASLVEEVDLEKALEDMGREAYREWRDLPYNDGQGMERMAELRVRRMDVPDVRYILVLRDVTEHTQQLYQLRMLHQIGQAMQHTLDLDRLLHAILTCVTAGPGFGFNRAVLLLMDEQGVLEERMRVGPGTPEEARRTWSKIGYKELRDYLTASLSSWEPQEVKCSYLRVPLDEGLLSSGLLRSPVVVRKGREGLDPTLAHLVSCSEAEEVVVLPLIAREELLGVIVADNVFTHRPVTEELIRMLSTFASQAGMAVANAEAHRKLRDAYSHIKEAQDHLVRAERLAAIGEVAARVAHEIRNPLVSIGGFARLISEDPSDPEAVRTMAGVIVREVSRLERILKNVMDFTAPGHPEFVWTDLNRVVKETAVLLTPEAERAEVSVHCDLSPGLPPTWLDPGQMKQVVLNLGRNAVQAMQDTGGELRFATCPGEEGLIFEVSDTGPGIEERELEEIFNPFYSLRGGLGLGLAIVRKIVEEHGGEISVRTVPGRGTTFRVVLPLRREDEMPGRRGHG